MGKKIKPKFRVVIINEAVRNRIKQIKAYAEVNVYDRRRMQEVINNDGVGRAGDNPEHVVVIPRGVRVVYSIEWQEPMNQWCRHISISVSGDENYPSKELVNEVAKLFDFTGTFPDRIGSVWIEKESEAINIVQAYER